MQNFELLKDSINKIQDDSTGIPEEFKYIGTGNPESKVLIIGKKAAINPNTHQHEKEIIQNYRYWKNMDNIDQTVIPSRNFTHYSALYPYKGQILAKNNNQNFGTSTTWMNYQKLCNYIFDNEEEKSITFHEFFFLTEVNSTPSEKTVNAVRDSIPFRKSKVLTSSFFQSFPIVIISGVGYFNVDNEVNEIEQIFGVKFKSKEYAEEAIKKQPFWIHRSLDDKKIVINTYQLSIGISDCLLKRVAKEIKESNLL